MTGSSRHRISVRSIQQIVSTFYKLPQHEMTSGRSDREVARPRQVAMFISRKTTDKSLPKLGQLFGGRDHTTVLHAIKQIERLMREDPTFKRSVEALFAKAVSIGSAPVGDNCDFLASIDFPRGA